MKARQSCLRVFFSCTFSDGANASYCELAKVHGVSWFTGHTQCK